ncbi:MAG: hypothetical protein SH809_04935 [Rhodothermales bacterium]|nr:hypothetical protein [Rhodothermales bacterium]
MKTYPVLFLSGVSAEFASFREAAANVIEMKECHAINQPGFATDHREVEQMLRSKLKDAEAVVHLVGFRYGVEPNVPDAFAPRCSSPRWSFTSRGRWAFRCTSSSRRTNMSATRRLNTNSRRPRN